MGFPNLRTVVVAFVIVPCLLATSLIGWFVLSGIEDRIEARKQEDLELIARTLRLPLGRALAQGRPDEILSAIESTVGIDQVYAAHVYDEAGRKIAGSGSVRVELPTAEAAELVSEIAPEEAYEELGDEELVSVFQPLSSDDGRITGLLQVTRRSGDVQDYLVKVRGRGLVAIAAIGLLLTAVIVVGHHLGVGRHVLRLEDDMARVRKGDRSHRLEAGGTAEFRALARGINRTLDAIAASQQEIERRRETELALRARLNRAEKMAAIGRLAAGVAHELGSPLSTLLGRAEQRLRHAAPGTADHEGLLAIREAAVRMEQTVRQLMDFGRSNPLNRAPLDVKALLQRLAEDAAPGDERVAIEIQCADGLPTVRVDALRTEQAVRNLLSNAVHAAHSRVRVAATSDARGLRIEVGDDGPGVPGADRNKIFDPFYTTKPVGQGTGLGLSVAAAVADDHGGHLTVEDDALGGARFVLLLPQEDRDAHAA